MNRARSNTKDDFDRVKDAVHKLRTENPKLRRQVATLKKELTRFTEVEFDQSLALEDVEAELILAPEPDETPTCPKCKSEDFSQVPAGKYLIKVCRACGYRKRHEVKRAATKMKGEV
jgi:hypothetical protein